MNSAAFILLATISHQTPPAEPLTRIAVVDLPDVDGRIDHLAFDGARQRLWIAALENDSLEIVDVEKRSHLRSIRERHTPTGIAFAPEIDRVLMANGESGVLEVFDAKTMERAHAVEVGDDADNVRWDPEHRRAIVGYGGGGLAIVDSASWKVVARVPLEGHPESFQLDETGDRAWVNVPDANYVACVDLKEHTVAETWNLTEIADAADNFPMALDTRRANVLIGCRTPARLLVCALEPRAGVLRVPPIELSGDVDDLFLDAALDRLYAACGAGFLDVFACPPADSPEQDRYASVARIPTAPGARTALFVPEARRLFLAVPHRGEQKSAVWIYSTPAGK
jgi:hypothetical protein